MTALFAVFWFGGAVTLAMTRFSSLSVLLLSSLIYSSPVFWTTTPNSDPTLVWCVVLGMTILSQIHLSKRISPMVAQLDLRLGQDKFMNEFFNASLIIVFLGILALSGGIGVFFEGKYGSVPGGNILIYYGWNSLLFITCAYNLCSRRLTDFFNLMCLSQILLIFIGGDRTLPMLYFVVFVLIYFYGVRPIALLRGRRIVLGISILLLVPLLAISKSIYTYLPEYGFSSDLFGLFIGEQFWVYAEKDFEPTHAHQILIYATSGSVDYSLDQFAVGVFSFLPGSSFLGIDPHAFSLAVKNKYFASWGEEAGIGAHFWAQGWVLGGFFGVIFFFIVLVFVLTKLDKIILISRNPAKRAIAFAVIAVLAFYIQRNSMEQILSFAGRYFSIFIILSIASKMVWSFSAKKGIRYA